MTSLILRQPTMKDAVLRCDYAYGDENYSHRFEFCADLDPKDPVVQRLVRWISAVHALYLFNFAYFTELEVEFPLEPAEKEFFERLAFNGMAEFRLTNHIPLATRTKYASASLYDTTHTSAQQVPLHTGTLLLNGGGKDGLVSSMLLDSAKLPYTWFMLNSSVAQDNVVCSTGKRALRTKRLIDQRRSSGQYRGHQPTSAAIATCAVLTAYLAGKAYVVASNEQSANEGNGLIDGVLVNHQYSKSLDFEQGLSLLLAAYGINVTYFSLLRPLHELQIVSLASHLTSERLRAFTSCNHGFKEGVWCLDCAKCAFVVLAFTAIDPKMAETIWGDRTIINRPELLPYLTQLLDPEMQKPLECVGTLKECNVAALLILRGPLQEHLTRPLRQLLNHHLQPMREASIQTFLCSVSDEHLIPTDFQKAIRNAVRYLEI